MFSLSGKGLANKVEGDWFESIGVEYGGAPGLEPPPENC